MQRPLLGGTFGLLGLAAIAFLWSRFADSDVRLLLALAGLALIIGGVGIAVSPAPARAWRVATSSDTDTPELTSAYRGGSPRAAGPRGLSGRSTAAVLVACLVVMAAAVPLSLHLPRWIEVESVLVAWWLVWTIVLTLAGVRGGAARDHDFVVHAPWAERPATLRTPHPRRSAGRWVLDILGPIDSLEAIVCLAAIAVVLGLVFLGAWLVVELAAPAVFFVAYAGVVHALRRARLHQGSTARAALAGMSWATVYVAPLGVTVWLAHLASHG